MPRTFSVISARPLHLVNGSCVVNVLRKDSIEAPFACDERNPGGARSTHYVYTVCTTHTVPEDAAWEARGPSLLPLKRESFRERRKNTHTQYSVHHWPLQKMEQTTDCWAKLGSSAYLSLEAHDGNASACNASLRGLSNEYVQPINFTQLADPSFAVPIYGYVHPLFFLITLVGNGAVIAILTRPHMRSPTNALLTGKFMYSCISLTIVLGINA